MSGTSCNGDGFLGNRVFLHRPVLQPLSEMLGWKQGAPTGLGRFRETRGNCWEMLQLPSSPQYGGLAVLLLPSEMLFLRKKKKEFVKIFWLTNISSQ